MARYAIARQVAPPAAGALTDGAATEAVTWTNARYDDLSIGVIQHIAAVPADRVFTEATAQAVATFQQTNGLLVDGKVGHQTLTAAFPERVGQNGHDQLVHIVADLVRARHHDQHERGPLRPDARSAAQSEFDPSGLRVIKLGAPAFQTSRILRDTLQGPAAHAPRRTPRRPARCRRSSTTSAPRSRSVRRPGRAPAPALGAGPSAPVGGPRITAWNEDLVQRLAAFQQAQGLPRRRLVDFSRRSRPLVRRADRRSATTTARSA